MRRLLTGIVVMMWVIVLTGGAFRAQSPSARGGGGSAAPARPEVGYPAPPIAGVDLTGKALFVNFWASWCGPCRLEMPEVQRLAANLPPGTAIVTVNTQDMHTADDMAAYLREKGYTFPAVVDTGGKAGQDYKVLSLPTSLFISPGGIVTARVNGPLTYGAMAGYLQAAGR